MPNQAPTTNATTSGEEAVAAKLIADDNGDQERLPHAELIANGNGDQERLTRTGEPLGATIRRPLPQRNRPMTNQAPITDATGSVAGVDGSEVIADGNDDQERVAHAEMIANGNGDEERLTRTGEPFAHRSDVRSPRGIAR